MAAFDPQNEDQILSRGVLMSSEFESFRKQCNNMYNRFVRSPVLPPQPYKKDSRYWLHKNRHRNTQQTTRKDGELTYAEVYSVISQNGRRFKKDSRVWLHKSTEKVFFIREKEQDQAKENTLRDDTGIDENSLHAMSKIEIGNEVRCQQEPIRMDFKDCFKRHHNPQTQDNLSKVSWNRNRKRRKLGCSAPASPVHESDLVLVVTSKSSDLVLGSCSNMRVDATKTDSTESVLGDWSEVHFQTRKLERKPTGWQEFMIIPSDSNFSRSCDEDNSPLSSGGSIDLLGDFGDTKSIMDVAVEDCKIQDQRSLTQVRVFTHESLDTLVTPPGSPWGIYYTAEEFDFDFDLNRL